MVWEGGAVRLLPIPIATLCLLPKQPDAIGQSSVTGHSIRNEYGVGVRCYSPSRVNFVQTRSYSIQGCNFSSWAQLSTTFGKYSYWISVEFPCSSRWCPVLPQVLDKGLIAISGGTFFILLAKFFPDSILLFVSGQCGFDRWRDVSYIDFINIGYLRDRIRQINIFSNGWFRQRGRCCNVVDCFRGRRCYLEGRPE